MEVFCNQEAMKPTRWPNDSLVAIGKVIDQGSIPRNGDFHKFMYNSARPTQLTLGSDSGFADYKNMNFELSPNSEVYK